MQKIVIIVPYFGSWPSWFGWFLETCRHNETVDWLFFTDCVQPASAPKNVYFRSMTLDQFNQRASEKLNLKINITRPYKICDLRPATREAFGRIVDAADLVFARDDISMEHAQEATGAPDHVRQAPDFTNLVKPERTVQSDDAERVCVVPNQRMVEKAETPEEAAAYVPLIGRCIEAVEANGLQPVLLLHGRDDAELADDIQEHVGRALPVHDESDPVELKRFLGESHLVIGSRFHALVGALSQGVPAVGTSWSHKYEMLFREYGCEDLLLSVHTEAEQVEACIEAAVGPERAELTVQIRQARDALIEETKAMWKEVDEVLEFTHKVGE